MTTRADLAQRYRKTSAATPWKTFVLEVHRPDSPEQLLADAFGPSAVRPTEDAFLHEVVVGGSTLSVDHLDERFWSFHSEGPVDEVWPSLKTVVERRRDLDWMWLPSQHLRMVWPGARPAWLKSEFRGRRLLPSTARVLDLDVQLRGEAADEVLGLVRERFKEAVSYDRIMIALEDSSLGAVQEAVGRQGRFVTRGDSFEFHQQVVSGVVRRYRRLVELIEQYAIRWEPLDEGGAHFGGSAIGIRFSRPIPDTDLFLDHLLSSREPFRLWGIPRGETAGITEVEAVDLHVGQRMRFDIASDWMRVYMFAGGCGNTVARLITNLQHHFDGALRLLDPALQQALDLTQS